MLLQPSDPKKSKEPDLPLDTPAEIERSREVDAARECRARRRIREGEADAVEIENARSRFKLTRERIYLCLGLLLLTFLILGSVCLFLLGEKIGAAYLLGSGSGVGGVGVIIRQLHGG